MLTKFAARVSKDIYSDSSEENLLRTVLPLLEKVGMGKLEMGFLDEKGKFYDRVKALRLAKSSGQLKEDVDHTRLEWLSPLDLKDFPR